MTTKPSVATRWDVVWLTVGAGVVAGLQVGKVPPAIPMLRESLELSLVAAGWTASLFNVVGAVLGAVAGIYSDRAGARRVMLVCLWALAMGSLTGALAPDSGWLLASRTLESFGFVGITVSGPRLLVAAAPPRDHALALGLWSTYMPTGMALAMFLAPAVLAVGGWRGLWWGNAAVIAAFTIVLTWATAARRWPAAPGPQRGGASLAAVAATLRRRGPWLLAGCFAVYTVPWFAVMTWLPTFLIETQGHSPAGAAAWAAVVVASNIIGNVAAGWALHRGSPRWLLLVAAFLAMALGGLGIFADIAPATWKLPLAILFSCGGGMLPGAVLAGAAVHAPRADQVGSVSGVIVQGANGGSLLGPPLLAALVATAGWHGGWLLIAACCAAGLLLTLALAASERQLGDTGASAVPGPGRSIS